MIPTLPLCQNKLLQEDGFRSQWICEPSRLLFLLSPYIFIIIIIIKILVIIMTTMSKMASSRLVAPISATQCCARLRLAFFDILDSDIDIHFLWYWGPWFWTSSLKLGTRTLIIMFMMIGSKWPCHRFLSSSKTKMSSILHPYCNSATGWNNAASSFPFAPKMPRQ